MPSRHVDRDKLADKIHHFLYHNSNVQKKIIDGRIVVPEDSWVDFLHDMGLMMGTYINECSKRKG